MTGPFDRWNRHVNAWYGLPDPPLPADPHIAWSAYCLIGDHLLCEHPDECGCTECGHPTAVDDDHDQRDQEQP